MAPLVTTTTALANLALARIGQPPLASIDEDTTVAAQVRALLDPVIRRVQADYPWPELTTRVSPDVALDGVADADGAYRYSLPSDCLRVLRLTGGWPWLLEGLYLCTRVLDPEVVYVRYEPDPSLWQAPLSSAVAASLAVAIVTPISQSDSLRDRLLAEYQDIIATSRRLASVGGQTSARLPTGFSWRRARHG